MRAINFKSYVFIVIFTLFSFENSYSQYWKPKLSVGLNLKFSNKIECNYLVYINDTSKIIDSCNVKNDSCDMIIERFVDFGDGHSSYLKNPSNNYLHSNISEYNAIEIKLRVKTQHGLIDSAIQRIIFSIPRPFFKTLGDTIVDVGDSVIFENIVYQPIYKPMWVWNFGDGYFRADTTGKNEGHIYYKPGVYDVFLEMEDEVHRIKKIRCSRIYPDTLGSKKRIRITVKKPSNSINYSLARIKISPNPVNDFLYINGSQSRFIEIYDIMGNEILKREFNKEIMLDLRSLKPGIYFIKSMNWYNYFYTKFIKL